MSFLQNASGTELVFWAFAGCGTLFFALRVLMMVIGGFGDDAADHGDAGHAHSAEGQPIGTDQHHSHSLRESDPAFKLVSINSITGFIMMFGWVGLASYSQFKLGIVVSIALAFSAGLATMVATALLFRFASKLTHPGEVYSIDRIIGLSGQVYMKIPAQGRGKVQVVCNGMTRYVDAISENGMEIDSFQDIQVTRIVDPVTVSVRRPARAGG